MPWKRRTCLSLEYYIAYNLVSIHLFETGQNIRINQLASVRECSGVKMVIKWKSDEVGSNSGSRAIQKYDLRARYIYSFASVFTPIKHGAGFGKLLWTLLNSLCGKKKKNRILETTELAKQKIIS